MAKPPKPEADGKKISESGKIVFCTKTRKGYIPVGPETGFKQKEN